MDNQVDILTADELDAIGELMNISMGAAATAVSTMLEKQVSITTPRLEQEQFKNIDCSALEPAVVVKIRYVEGLTGENVIMLRRNDMQVILDLLMGNEFGTSSEDFQFDEMTMSAACEVMNQMMGASATALSEILNKTVNISTPEAQLLETYNEIQSIFTEIHEDDKVVAVSFRMMIKDIMDTNFTCFVPVHMAREIVQHVNNVVIEEEPATMPPQMIDDAPLAPPPPVYEQQAPMAPPQQFAEAAPPPVNYAPPAAEPVFHETVPPMSTETAAFTPPQAQPMPEPQQAPPVQQPAPQMQPPAAPVYEAPQPQPQQAPPAYQPQGAAYYPPAGQQPQMPYPQQPYPYPPQYGMAPNYPAPRDNAMAANIKGAQFPDFSGQHLAPSMPYGSNMGLLMSVQLEVSVVVGRTKRKIKDIMDFGQGSVVLLDTQTGAPAEIVVNGQLLAYGDVVVVGDNFGVRITEIVGTKELMDSLK